MVYGCMFGAIFNAHIFAQMGSMLGMGEQMNTDTMASKLMDILPTIRMINEQFKDEVTF